MRVKHLDVQQINFKAQTTHITMLKMYGVNPHEQCIHFVIDYLRGKFHLR